MSDVQGLRRRTRRSHTEAYPAPPDPREPENYLNPNGSDVVDEPQSTRDLADLGPQNPSYPSPRDPLESATAAELGSGRNERGNGRRLLSEIVGTVLSSVRAHRGAVGEVVAEGRRVGVVASYADDLAYQGIPGMAPPTVESDLPELGVRQNLSDDDEDHEADNQSLPQRAEVRSTSHHLQTEAEEICIIPGWRVRVRSMECTGAFPVLGRGLREIPSGNPYRLRPGFLVL